MAADRQVRGTGSYVGLRLRNIDNKRGKVGSVVAYGWKREQSRKVARHPSISKYFLLTSCRYLGTFRAVDSFQLIHPSLYVLPYQAAAIGVIIGGNVPREVAMWKQPRKNQKDIRSKTARRYSSHFAPSI